MYPEEKVVIGTPGEIEKAALELLKLGYRCYRQDWVGDNGSEYMYSAKFAYEEQEY